MYSRTLHSAICATCRLRSRIAAQQLARSRTSAPVTLRPLTTTTRLKQSAATPRRANEDDEIRLVARGQDYSDTASTPASPPTEAASKARAMFGAALPEGYLPVEAYKAYVRLYGTPSKYDEHDVMGANEEDGGVLVGKAASTELLKEGHEGGLEDVEFKESKIGVDALTEEVEETSDEADDFVPAYGDETLANDMRLAFSSVDQVNDGERGRAYPGEEEGDEEYLRTHPLTLANRFGTAPTTLAMPKASLVDPIAQQLTATPNIHLAQAAHRVFGGVGLPYSTSTPVLGKTMQQKPIGLDAAQSHMSDIEGDAFLAALVPGMYAGVMSVLVETRKRLGTAWAEEMVAKAGQGELRILDAGGAGAGVLAVREFLRAEWERMHEDGAGFQSNMALAEADGKLGGASASPPLGAATVLTGSEVLRKRASNMLENTAFIPRLPDYLHTEDAKRKGKFDIIIAPHTLWPLKEDYIRKTHLQNLWNLLSQDGGVLVLLEKGIARGFELVAAARSVLLDSRISSPNLHTTESGVQPSDSLADQSYKERGMIIAPCTNHAGCPMYQPQGMVKGRRDICHFSQRYVRPPFLQRILHAKDKNWEDVKFSYLSIMRGRDLRGAANAEEITQGDAATDRAFSGYGHALPETLEQDHTASTGVPHSLNLPRAVLPPLKRRGHVILDLCTPSGTLERWTVPRSFSKQAFRDARKSSWGDLWALGAKTRVARNPKVKKRAGNADINVMATKVTGGGLDIDEYGRIVSTAGQVDRSDLRGGRSLKGGMMRGRRVKGVRDKRDKRATGNGRKRYADAE